MTMTLVPPLPPDDPDDDLLDVAEDLLPFLDRALAALYDAPQDGLIDPDLFQRVTGDLEELRRRMS